MKISDLYASAWENAIVETAYFVNNLDKSPNTYTQNDWVVLEPFAIANQLEFDENGFLIEVPDEPVEGCGDTQYFADMSNVACSENVEASNYPAWCYNSPEEYEAAQDDNDGPVVLSDGMEIADKSEAYTWLRENVEQYGNTYFWDSSLKADLNKLIERFGNTYFWRS